MVCRATATISNLHGHLDPKYFYIRYLLQALRFDGYKKMKDLLLLPAIFIFALLVVGLVLTVFEFKKISNKTKKDEVKTLPRLEN